MVGCLLGSDTLEGARDDAKLGVCGEEWLDIDTLGVGGAVGGGE
jgi:hypothetical protein